MKDERRAPLDFDWILLASVLALAVVGLLFINSTKATDGVVAPEVTRQILAMAVGLAGLVIITRVDYHRLMALAPWAYGATLVLNVVVLFVGREVGGNKAWLRLAGFSIQPAELMKVTTLMLLASLAARRETRVRFLDLMFLGAVVAAPVLVILKQSDTGTAVTFLPVLAVVVFVGGIRWRWIVLVGLLVVAMAPLAWSQLKPYQRERVLITLEPERDPSGKGYQSIQSMIAVGSGGLLGQGYKEGPQNRLGFLPERHTDFIFAIVSEEAGFLGALLVLALYAIVMQRLLEGAVLARDRLGGLLCLGPMVFIAVHVAVNVGMVLGLFPVIGITLPLFSYGGSSMIAFLAMIGLALNVRMRRFGR